MYWVEWYRSKRLTDDGGRADRSIMMQMPEVKAHFILTAKCHRLATAWALTVASPPDAMVDWEPRLAATAQPGDRVTTPVTSPGNDQKF